MGCAPLPRRRAQVLALAAKADFLDWARYEPPVLAVEATATWWGQFANLLQLQFLLYQAAKAI